MHREAGSLEKALHSQYHSLGVNAVCRGRFRQGKQHGWKNCIFLSKNAKKSQKHFSSIYWGTSIRENSSGNFWAEWVIEIRKEEVEHKVSKNIIAHQCQVTSGQVQLLEREL